MTYNNTSANLLRASGCSADGFKVSIPSTATAEELEELNIQYNILFDKTEKDILSDDINNFIEEFFQRFKNNLAH